MMENILNKDNIRNIKNNSEKDKKILLIQDLDLECLFLLQV